MTPACLRRSVVIALAIVWLSIAASVPSAQDQKVDISGTWTFDVQTDAGGGTPTVTLKQDGEKLTGHYSSTTLGEADLTGSVTGREFTFSFSADVQGNAIPVTYSGTIESATSMKGKIAITGLGEGTFTATKK